MKTPFSLKKLILFLILFASISPYSHSQMLPMATSTQSGPVDIGFGYTMINPLFYDSLYCQTVAICNYDITISNSTITDTLFIISDSYTVQSSYVNTSGSPFYLASTVLVGPITTQLSVISGSDPYGFVLFPQNINKIICGGDTLDVTGLMASNNYPQLCTYSTISGTAFVDNNNDCLLNSGDQGISSIYITGNSTYTIGNTTYPHWTNPNGGFGNTFFKSNGFVSADFTLPPLYNFAYTLPSCATPIVTITSLPASGIDFPRNCAADVDLAVSGNSSLVRPLLPFVFYPDVRNIGCSQISGVLKLVLDPNVIYNSSLSSNPADYVIGDTLFWNYTNLSNVGISSTGYWNSFTGGISLTPVSTVNVGDTIHLEIITGTPINDAFPSNNSTWVHLPVVNSYDPNIKEVSPKGIGPAGNIPPTTQKLTYTIHFQNTGNADALNIFILDTLEGDLKHNTLRILSASHNMNPEWLSNSVVKFNFPGINLPDSTSNEPESHGFVNFEIDILNALPIGTEIENTAHIYFDNNPAIVTNTTLNTLFESGLNVMDLSTDLDVTISPNPMHVSTLISISNSSDTRFNLTLTDLTGKIIYSKNNTDTKSFYIEKGNIQSGVYIYKIASLESGAKKIGRLIVH